MKINIILSICIFPILLHGSNNNPYDATVSYQNYPQIHIIRDEDFSNITIDGSNELQQEHQAIIDELNQKLILAQTDKKKMKIIAALCLFSGIIISAIINFAIYSHKTC